MHIALEQLWEDRSGIERWHRALIGGSGLSMVVLIGTVVVFLAGPVG